MKEEEIKIRVTPSLKKDFQNICEHEDTTMSNKINNFIVKEVKVKKITTVKDKILTKKLIKFGVMNSNGRLYRKSELLKTTFDADGVEQTELERLNKQVLYGQFGYAEGATIIHKYNATHSISNLRINEDWLVGDVAVLNDSIIPILDNLVFRPRSFGFLDKKGVVHDLEIIGFDAVPKSEDKFIEVDED
jgi:hypothetical protein